MSLQLQPDQLLTALCQAEHVMFLTYLNRLLQLSDDMAASLCEITPNVQINGDANFWDGMVCVPIAPIDAAKPIPDHLKGLDDGGWD